MLEFLKPLKNQTYDFLTFLEGKKDGSIEILSQDYANPGEKIGGSVMGDSYHIILFRDHKEDKDAYSDLDRFEAILADPLEYISRLIPAGFYGIIARQTTTSTDIINRLVDRFNENV
jgi:hypothetical protein